MPNIITGTSWGYAPAWVRGTYRLDCAQDITGTGTGVRLGTTFTRRVVRGGSWVEYQDYARATCRRCCGPDGRFNSLGIRLCLK